MQNISEMIKRLCPEGVEHVRLDNVCSFLRGKTITAKDAVDGGIHVIAGGQTPSYYHNVANRLGESITIAGSGAYAGFVSYWNIPIYVSDAFTVEPQECLIHKYLYHYLKQNQQKIFDTQKGAGVPHVHGKDIANFEIPLPPLPIQQEIVRILDSFTSMITNLETELASRQKQYEYYRNKLLTFDENDGSVEWKTLKEISENCDKQRKPISSSKRVSGEYPYYGASGIVDYVEGYIFDGDYLLISEDGANLVARSTPIAFSISGKNWVNNHAHVIKFEHRETRRLVEIYLNSIDLSPWITGGAQPKLNQEKLNTIPLPVPPFEKQKEIVSTLDTFESLITNIKQELEARKKQYEYYREQLLRFG